MITRVRGQDLMGTNLDITHQIFSVNRVRRCHVDLAFGRYVIHEIRWATS
jgi:hypothetical protein